MSSNHRNHHPSSGQTYASYTHRSTATSAIPTTINPVTTGVLNATTMVPGNATATPAAAAPEKRGRGRPRKIPVETTQTNNNDDDDEDDSSSASENAPEVVPRKRGRPPKLNKVVKPPVDPSVIRINIIIKRPCTLKLKGSGSPRFN
ncbi:hypothetical protein BGZ47_004573, partial [Haplosporangium gracile]